MDILWSPWRYRYVAQARPDDECLFCRVAAAALDGDNYVLHRGERNFVLLNRYPYTNGHLMIAPYAHVATLQNAGQAVMAELIELTRRAEALLGAAYRPKGFNIGMNLGECAGAGVAGHIHMHVLPRWPGDVNFMTALGETRVLPEDLAVTYDRLRQGW
jgi:ATP adenylyltransferase